MAIPWIRLIKHAPAVLSLSREVLQATRQKRPSEAGDDTERLQKLEDDLVAQAEVIHALAGQIEGLSAAVNALRRGVILGIFLGALSLLLAGTALALILLGG